jgi:hypothetical protein
VNGFITAIKEACSAPVQVAITFTDPALCVALVPHPTAVKMAASDRIRLRFNHKLCILKSPFECFGVPLLGQPFYYLSFFEQLWISMTYELRLTTSLNPDGCEVDPRTTRLVASGAGDTTVLPFIR